VGRAESVIIGRAVWRTAIRRNRLNPVFAMEDNEGHRESVFTGHAPFTGHV
jgi:hypothetical protein